jgi:hypothetical protein
VSPRAKAVEVVDNSSGDTEVTVTSEAVTAVEVPAGRPAAVETQDAETTVETTAGAGVDTVEVVTPTVVELEVAKPAPIALPVPSEPDVLEVIAEGPQGIQGAKGDTGDRGLPGPAGPGAAYVHYQNVAASVWNVPHMLGFHPAVTVQDSAGTSVEGEVTYLDADNVRITFTAAFGGVAYLS